MSAAKYGSNHLLEANVLLIDQEKCSQNGVYGRVLDHTMFCAGHMQGGVDSCQVSKGSLTVMCWPVVRSEQLVTVVLFSG